MAASTARPPMATMANVPIRIGSWYGIDSRLSRPKISLVRLMWSIVTLHGKVGRGRDANLGALVGGALGVGRQHFIGADGVGADAAVQDGVVQRRIDGAVVADRVGLARLFQRQIVGAVQRLALGLGLLHPGVEVGRADA